MSNRHIASVPTGSVTFVLETTPDNGVAMMRAPVLRALTGESCSHRYRRGKALTSPIEDHHA